MSYVFVVDTNKKPLNPVHPGEARFLLKAGKAAVLKRYPFTLVLKRALERPVVQPLRVKLDPGSRTTGIAVVHNQSGKVVFAAELSHQGQAIHAALLSRRAVRRSRRARHTRYRKPRFDNRRRKVAVRRTGSFNITTPTGTVQGISHRFCTVLHHCDDYSYHMGTGERSADRLSFLHRQ